MNDARPADRRVCAARGGAWSRRGACAAGLLAALAGAVGCGAREARPVPVPAPPPAPLVVTVVPAGPAPGAAPTDVGVGLPDGARLLRLDVATPGAAPVELAAGLASAGEGSVNAEGTRLAFVGRAKAGGPAAVWTCAPDGSGRREVAPSPSDRGAPAWLPDGRLVFAGVVDGPAPVAAWGHAWALFVAADDGSPATRITFGAGLEVDPAVLPDGRVVFVGWQPTDADAGAFALFTVHPDGSGVAAYHGGDGVGTPRRPRVAADGRVAFVTTAADGTTRAWALDRRWPAGPASEVTAARGARVVTPRGGDGFLAVGEGGLGTIEGGGAPPTPVAAALPAGTAAWAAATLAPSPRPQGHLSFVDPKTSWGQLLGLDARFPRTAAAARVRVRRYDRAAPRVEGDVVVEAPLEADGSFFVRVPPDAPLLVDVLDATGAVVERSRTPIWVRPRETRGCVGCHDDGDVSPPNRRPMAVTRDAVAPREEARR
ncbi:MAG: hypothetical protein U1E39_12780 [Planctomycetota bacterium]